jgi:hypothetical protein
MLLFPADVLHPRRPDEHFAAEAAAARNAGLEIALVDHDLLAAGRARQAVARVPSGLPVDPGADSSTADPTDGSTAAPAAHTDGCTAVYRGWMLRGDRYAGFVEALAERGVRLRTSAEQYRRAHELPGWYPALAEVTPRSVWTVGDDRAGFDRAREELGDGPGVLRDYTKSMKHYWHEAVFVPDLTDAAAAWAVASRLRELRDDEFSGGFVLRRFELFDGGEVRTWWVEGVCRLVTAHPDTAHDQPSHDPSHQVDLSASLSVIAPLVAGLGLRFVTVDLARRTDGVWRVIELGDGQVSDRPATTPPEDLIDVAVSHRASPTSSRPSS